MQQSNLLILIENSLVLKHAANNCFIESVATLQLLRKYQFNLQFLTFQRRVKDSNLLSTF